MYMLLCRIDSKKSYKIICCSDSLEEIKNKHTYLLNKYDPDQLMISLLKNVRVSVEE